MCLMGECSASSFAGVVGVVCEREGLAVKGTEDMLACICILGQHKREKRGNLCLDNKVKMTIPAGCLGLGLVVVMFSSFGNSFDSGGAVWGW